uniref:Reverse transcriptase domain-containing protein n=1 Tax=Tanacetum cinerariifolium TaxID=118510 RepID=A0A699HYK2_TANCI|nr:hypothetical protein [Tanacetum cinerariifolium]
MLIQQKLQNEYARPFPSIAITFDLPTVETEDSLRMGDEHLDTIPATKSDEIIKSSVENLVPSPSKSEDLSDSECDVPACDDFTTFSNLLFDADDDFSSRSLLNHDSSIISSSSQIGSLLDEFAGKLILLKSIPPGIDETDCDPEEEIRLIEKLLYDNSSPRPPEEFISKNYDAEIESFFPSPIPVEDGDSLWKKLIYLLLWMNRFHRALRKMIMTLKGICLSLKNYNDSRILNVKMVGDISKHDVPMPRLLPTQPTLVSNQEESPHLLSYQGLKASQLHSKCPMMIYGGNTPI